jgi:hypothetical protein
MATEKRFSWRCRKCRHHNPSARDICRGWQCEEPRPGYAKQAQGETPPGELPVKKALQALALLAAKRQPYTPLIDQLTDRFEMAERQKASRK